MSADPSVLTPALPSGQSAEHLQVRLRPDLVVQPQFYEGVTHYVIKDPIGLKYFRFKPEEYFLLQQLDGRRPLQEVKKAFERKYRPQTIAIDDLMRFGAQLHEAGIAQVDTPDQGKVLIRRRRKNTWKRFGNFMANILYVKIPVIDPEKLLTWMYPYFKWIYTKTFIFLSSMLMLSAIILVISQWQDFQAKLPEFQSFFNWRTIVAFWCSLAVVKVIHEFGHGLTAKHFGGEVHEMGMLFLVLTPALYCDVTDSWLLPNKWHRIWISAAGIYVECTLAAIATWIWFYTDPGLLNSLMMATMFICSVNTILFNANPLLRYDGYYVMADWLEVPNLRIKSTQFFGYLFQEKIMGLEIPVQNYMPRSRRFLFVTYAVASFLYRWVITFSIVFFLINVLKPYKLESIGYILAVCSLIPLAFMPIYQIIKFLRTPGRLRKMKKARTAGFFAGVAALITGVLLIPTPLRVQGTLVLAPEKPALVYGETPGRLVSLEVKDGDPVEEGQVIARLSNPELQRERMARQEEQAVHMAWFESLDHTQSAGNRAMARVRQEQGADLEEVIDRINDQIRDLTITAPRSGVAMKVPKRETIGQHLKPGKPFCEVADPHKLEARLILDQSDVDLIRTDRQAWIKIYGLSETTFHGKVSEISKRNREQVPPELSHQAGGEIATKPDPKDPQSAKPVTAVYDVVIPVDNQDLLLQAGLRGFAKIDGGHSSLGWWLWRLITKTFHFTL